MNLSRNWLSDFVNTDGIENQEYCDRMTATGSKVEGFEVLGEDIENVVVAKVTHMEKHPEMTKTHTLFWLPQRWALISEQSAR